MDFSRMTWVIFLLATCPMVKAGAMALYGTTISGGSPWDLEMARGKDRSH